MYTTGDNSKGQLGLGHLDATRAPKRVASEVPFIYVGCGSDHTITMTEEGQVYGCGCNRQGQIGLGEYVDCSHTLCALQLEPCAQVATTTSHTLFLASM